jgi:hypothetical protein
MVGEEDGTRREAETGSCQSTLEATVRGRRLERRGESAVQRFLPVTVMAFAAVAGDALPAISVAVTE